MSKPRIFVDGSEGTTGLEINERLAGRHVLDVIAIDPAQRKDPAARRAMICSADLVFLCLPDAASKEAVSLAADCPTVRFIDASTAHRTDPAWVYGLPELRKGAQRAAIRDSKRVANPGCHATGFLSVVAPLVDLETLRALEDALLEFAGSIMVISHDRWFLDRIATHILAAEGDSQWVFFNGNYQEYEADKKRRLGEEGAKPKRMRFKALK